MKAQALDSDPLSSACLGRFALTALLLVFGGLRFGLNPEAPRVGVFAGLTVGAAGLYREDD